MAIKKINIGGVNHELQTTTANITDLTATAKELNYMSGVTSNIQTQINDKHQTYTQSITITGNANTYYPVAIPLPHSKERIWTISVWKNLGSTTPSSYSGNHGNGTSSLWLVYEGRSMTWDGNGGFIKTIYKSQPYASLVARTDHVGNGSCFLFVWLRGGTCSYNISTDYSATSTVYYESTNLGTSTYPINVEPLTSILNGGLVTTGLLGYGDIQGNATSADKLTTNAGDSNTPVYFSNGVPVACSSLDLNTTGNAATATTARISESDKGIATSGTGSAYTATVSGITALSAGVTFIMIPNTVSTTTTPTLNVNSLGAKQIRRRLSNNTATAVAGSTASWLAANKPVRVTYDGTYWIIDTNRPSATDIYGTIPITSGGTGATTAASARNNLGAMANVAVTSSDAGKFLRVNSSGVWAAERVPSAESTSF